jgi:CheY-like chemotaxis protein
MMSEKARIIICDDEEPMRELLEELLTDEGYAVTTARNGADLRRLVPQIRPDLVICDLKMPGEDGLSLTRWLRA